MPRRTSRRSRDEDAFGAAIGLAALAGFVGYGRWLMLPIPWRVVSATLVTTLLLRFSCWLVAFLRRRRAARLLRTDLQALTPDDFERRVHMVLSDLGWSKLERRGGAGDRGVDLVGQYQGKRYIVQCKRYAKPVPPAMVRDLVGALHIQRADRALLVTTSGFSAQGYAEAKDQPLDLWDGAELLRQIQRAEVQRTNPERLRSARQRARAALYGFLLINSVALAWAFAAAGLPL